MIDTPGFGEAVDNTECWTPILDYVEDQFDGYLEAETRVERVEVGNNHNDDDNDDDNDGDNDDDDDDDDALKTFTVVGTEKRKYESL